MKAWTFLFILIMITSCSGSSNSQDLTWYNKAVISEITRDPDQPRKFLRISIGISPQVFYVSKDASNYSSILEKLQESYKKKKAFNIGIEKGTNVIKQVNEMN